MPSFALIYGVAFAINKADIYNVRPAGRLEPEVGIVLGSDIARLEPKGFYEVVKDSLYFSLLSAFNLGWQWLDVSSWIARLQPRECTLRAVGRLRVVAGVQSL